MSIVAQSYGFETPQLFLKDFGVLAVLTSNSSSWSFDGTTPTLDAVTKNFAGAADINAQVILSLPGEDISGRKIESNQYEIEYITAQLSLIYGVTLLILGQKFRVLTTYPLSDGVFSRAKIETTS
jgi:hypothetical protein